MLYFFVLIYFFKGALIIQSPRSKPSDDDSVSSDHTENIQGDIAQLKDSLFNLTYKYKSLGIVTKVHFGEIKQTYRDFIGTARSLITKKKDLLAESNVTEVYQALVTAVNQFSEIVDNRVICQNWLGTWEKAGMMRLKADFLRYIFEVEPTDEFRRKCLEAYKNARLFFIENDLQNKAEWVYLQMNYASFLYSSGSQSAAHFLSKKLANSLVAKRCGKDIQQRLKSNLILYSRY